MRKKEGIATFCPLSPFCLLCPQRKAKFTLDKELRAGRPNTDFEPLCLESLTKIQIMRSQHRARDKGIHSSKAAARYTGCPWNKETQTKCRNFFCSSIYRVSNMVSTIGNGVKEGTKERLQVNGTLYLFRVIFQIIVSSWSSWSCFLYLKFSFESVSIEF